MSRSLHTWIEFSHRREDGSGWYASFGDPHLGADHTFQSLMEGVGIHSVYEMKGLPADLSWECQRDCTFLVNNEIAALCVDEYCSRATAEDWVQRGISRYIRQDLVTDPDMYWESWMTVSELEEVHRRYQVLEGSEYRLLGAAISAMRVLNDPPSMLTRLVFWFRA